jgi:hypothetical protein
LGKIIQVPYEGKMVSAEQLEFEAEKEPWSIYKFEDGTIMRIKTVVGTVARIVDHYKPDGEPIYVFGMGGVPILEVPPGLKKANKE